MNKCVSPFGLAAKRGQLGCCRAIPAWSNSDIFSKNLINKEKDLATERILIQADIKIVDHASDT